MVQAQERPAVVLNNVDLLHSLGLQVVGPSLDAGIPLVRNAGEDESQLQQETFSHWRSFVLNGRPRVDPCREFG